MNPLFKIDFYKVGHVDQYPRDTEQVWSNWTPRYTHRKDSEGIVWFGLQAFLLSMADTFEKHFFRRPLVDVLAEYQSFMQDTLGVKPRTDHIRALHQLGHLPLEIHALPEGCVVPYGVPPMVVTNTRPEAFWLPNYIETWLSNELWLASTSATTARKYRQVCEKWARNWARDRGIDPTVADLSYVNYQCHDFSYRGMGGLDAAERSGMGHLLFFNGTDTVPAILAARRFYSADENVGKSIPATEHSVMCAGGQSGEFETFKRLITEVYPTGPVAIVSDTWDLWKVLGEYAQDLRQEIWARVGGPVVFRPDSGDPIKIMCGDLAAENYRFRDGALVTLANSLGTRDGLIQNGRVIYGDSITLDRAEEILAQTVGRLRLSPENVVLGVGSFTYQYNTRDTDGWAMKATAVRRRGEVLPIFKKPVTDNGGKFSLKGIPLVFEDNNGGYLVETTENPARLRDCAYRLVFDGVVRHVETFAKIRERAKKTL